MEIERPEYLQQLIDAKMNGSVKILTGIRRCGKSYILRKLFKDHLLNDGVPYDHILEIDLEQTEDDTFLNPIKLERHIKSLLPADKNRHSYSLTKSNAATPSCVKVLIFPDFTQTRLPMLM